MPGLFGSHCGFEMVEIGLRVYQRLEKSNLVSLWGYGEGVHQKTKAFAVRNILQEFENTGDPYVTITSRTGEW